MPESFSDKFSLLKKLKMELVMNKKDRSLPLGLTSFIILPPTFRILSLAF